MDKKITSSVVLASFATAQFGILSAQAEDVSLQSSDAGTAASTALKGVGENKVAQSKEVKSGDFGLVENVLPKKIPGEKVGTSDSKSLVNAEATSVVEGNEGSNVGSEVRVDDAGFIKKEELLQQKEAVTENGVDLPGENGGLLKIESDSGEGIPVGSVKQPANGSTDAFGKMKDYVYGAFDGAKKYASDTWDYLFGTSKDSKVGKKDVGDKDNKTGQQSKVSGGKDAGKTGKNDTGKGDISVDPNKRPVMKDTGKDPKAENKDVGKKDSKTGQQSKVSGGKEPGRIKRRDTGKSGSGKKTISGGTGKDTKTGRKDAGKVRKIRDRRRRGKGYKTRVSQRKSGGLSGGVWPKSNEARTLLGAAGVVGAAYGASKLVDKVVGDFQERSKNEGQVAPVNLEPRVVDTPVNPEPRVVDTPVNPEPRVVDTPVNPEPGVVDTPVNPEPGVVDTPVNPEPGY